MGGGTQVGREKMEEQTQGRRGGWDGVPPGPGEWLQTEEARAPISTPLLLPERAGILPVSSAEASKMKKRS